MLPFFTKMTSTLADVQRMGRANGSLLMMNGDTGKMFVKIIEAINERHRLSREYSESLEPEPTEESPAVAAEENKWTKTQDKRSKRRKQDRDPGSCKEGSQRRQKL